MSLLCSSVNRGKRKGGSPGTYLGLPATVEATRVVASSSVINMLNQLSSAQGKLIVLVAAAPAVAALPPGIGRR